jgi:DNA-binding GntR family transcriptional regulator
VKSPIQPVDKNNLASRVYFAIRESLIAGRYVPSYRLRISETAQLLGTSDTPVREALLRLVSEHALEMETAKQIAVPALSVARYLEIRTVRLALESTAVEIAARNIGAKDLAELVRINKRFMLAETSHNAEQQLRYNREFHFGIYIHSRLPMLLAMIENMWASMGPILRAFYENEKSEGSYAQGHSQHDLLLHALEVRDSTAAVKAIRADLMSAAPSIERFLKAHETANVKSPV